MAPQRHFGLMGNVVTTEPVEVQITVGDLTIASFGIIIDRSFTLDDLLAAYGHAEYIVDPEVGGATCVRECILAHYRDPEHGVRPCITVPCVRTPTAELESCDLSIRNYIVNGSFQDRGQGIPGNHGRYNRGSWGTFIGINGWYAGTHSIHGEVVPIELHRIRASGVPAYPDEWPADQVVAELDAHPDGVEERSSLVHMAQCVRVPRVGSYRLEFDYTGRNRGRRSAEATSDYAILVNDQEIHLESEVADEWRHKCIVFSAPSTHFELAFEGRGREDRYGLVITNVYIRERF